MFAARNSLFAAAGMAALYMDVATSGATVTEDGDFKVAVFNDSGTFTVNNLGSDATYGNKVDYLVVAGGGGGGTGTAGGGGGAGGVLTNNTSVTTQTYTITVGAGGSVSVPGSNSSFGTIAIASGGGQGGNRGGLFRNGGSGGSGGGGSATTAGGGSLATGGSGVSGQGFDGGDGQFGKFSAAGAGGGGAGEIGTDALAIDAGGNGGDGITSSITGASVYYAGGGGGAAEAVFYGVGGLGGGGPTTTGGVNPSGVANSGGGGAGGGSGAGGKGVVIIRWRFKFTPDVTPSNLTWWNDPQYDSYATSFAETNTVTIAGINTPITLRAEPITPRDWTVTVYVNATSVGSFSANNTSNGLDFVVNQGDTVKFRFDGPTQTVDTCYIEVINKSDNSAVLDSILCSAND